CPGACPSTTTTSSTSSTTTTYATSPSTTSTSPPTTIPITTDVDGTYCVRESWSVSVTGSRIVHKTGVVTGTIQVVDGGFNLIYRHVRPLPFGRTFGSISYDGSEYEVDSQSVLANVAEHITARQFYALVNLSFAQILVPLQIGFPSACYFPHLVCLNAEDTDQYSAFGGSLSSLQG